MMGRNILRNSRSRHLWIPSSIEILTAPLAYIATSSPTVGFYKALGRVVC